MNYISRLSALMISVAVWPLAAQAQDFERVAPKVPSQPVAPKLATPPGEQMPPSQDQTLLAPVLKGLMFLNGAAALEPEGVTDAGLSVETLPLLDDPDVKAHLQSYIGQPLTRADLAAIQALVRERYRKAEHPFIDVSVPPQNIQSGVVQIVVTEYRLGAVNVTGNRYFSTEQIVDMSDLKSGDPLNLPVLHEHLSDLNQNPFMTVSAVMAPGDSTGTSNITLEVADRRPWRVYAGYDNQGVASLGRDNWNVGVNWGNPFGSGQVLSYQFTRSFSGRYTSHSLSDVISLSGDDKLLLFGAYATQVPEIAPAFKSEGHSGQLSARWVRDLPDRTWLNQSFQLGVDYKRTDNDLEFFGLTLLDTTAEIIQIPLTYELTLIDPHGQTTLEALLVYAPGGLTYDNSDEAIRQLVPGSGATYAYQRYTMTRTTWLPKGMSWIVRATAQIASRNLPYSEQMGGGGIGSVRGYDPDTALGSEGLLLSQELRFKPFSPMKALHISSDGGDRMQFGVFWDYAKLTQPTPILDLPTRVRMDSIGFNAHYNIGSRFDVQVEVGSQLRPAPGTDERETRVAVIASVGF